MATSIAFRDEFQRVVIPPLDSLAAFHLTGRTEEDGEPLYDLAIGSPRPEAEG
jgi:hypothetical protein